MATAAESARSRDAAETQAAAVYAAASAYVASEMVAGGTPNPEAPSPPVVRASGAMALALTRSVPSRYGSRIPKDLVSEETVADVGADIAKQAVEQSTEHWATITERVTRSDPEATPAEVAKVFVKDKAWQEAAARTLATREAALTALALVDDVNAAAGEKHRVLWISRGDARVRTSHRKLHGKHRKPGSAFKTWPTGQRLAFPGDPRAPLDEVINCRCSLLLVPTSTSHEALDTFRVSDEDFDLVASGARVWSQAEDDLRRELTVLQG